MTIDDDLPTADDAGVGHDDSTDAAIVLAGTAGRDRVTPNRRAAELYRLAVGYGYLGDAARAGATLARAHQLEQAADDAARPAPPPPAASRTERIDAGDEML